MAPSSPNWASTSGLQSALAPTSNSTPIPPFFLGHEGGDAWTEDAGDGFHAEDAAHQHGAGVAGAGEGIELAFLHQVEADADAALRLGLQRLGRVVVHGDIVLAGNDIELRRGRHLRPSAAPGSGAWSPISTRRTSAGKLARSQHSTTHGHFRTVVAAHDVQSDPHAVRVGWTCVGKEAYAAASSPETTSLPL